MMISISMKFCELDNCKKQQKYCTSTSIFTKLKKVLLFSAITKNKKQLAQNSKKN